jgi:hypothetical protein
LPDLVSVALLTKVFPAEVVDAVITQCDRTEQRRRSLPARSMASFAMGMALHAEGSYEEVLAMISDGRAWAHRDQRSGKLANTAAISHARERCHSILRSGKGVGQRHPAEQAPDRGVDQ